MDGNASTEFGGGIIAELSMCPYCYSHLSARLRALQLRCWCSVLANASPERFDFQNGRLTIT